MAAPNNWKHYDGNYPLSPYVKEWWQKTFYFEPDGRKVGANLLGYPPKLPEMPHWSYELHIQIPENLSITGSVINANNFVYQGKDVDWQKVEDDTKKIVKALVKRTFILAR